MKNRRAEENDNRKKRGRPQKKKKLSINSGRKRVPTHQCSRRTMYRRAKMVLESVENNSTILETAARISKANKPLVIGDELKEIPAEKNKMYIKHTRESALAFFLENEYSKQTWTALSQDSRERGCPIYPSYDTLQLEMAECKPLGYCTSEIEVKVSLQNILNKTIERLCNAVCSEWDPLSLRNLELLVTLGFDSSSGHINPHQKYEQLQNGNKNPQQSLFVTSVVIIKLIDKNDKYSWTNPTPQSVRFCRPLRIALEKEDDEATITEFNRLQNEITNLVRHSFKLSNEKVAKVKYSVSQTLFDGKCVNTIIGNNATSRCPICLATCHQFNNSRADFTPNQSSLQYGLGLLHCQIKAFEHLLHISYRKTVGTWDVREHLKGKFLQ